ncbi:M17 family peptidase N-terminal domain-containing protein [Dissulfurispira sp.]|uniref:M17 family peptidase N-terminal domain-containing protein n=1 Tax=Dissulfurispira sp. TaxID=2817609 RepID=UPI002FD8E653
MNILIKNIPEEGIKADALVLPLFENNSIDIYSDIDSITGGFIRRVINSKEFTGKQNQTALLHVRNINSDRILLIGLGKQSDITTDRIRQAGGKAFSFLRDIGVKDIAVSSGIFDYLPKSFKASQRPVFYFMEGGLLSLYKFENTKNQKTARR